jgi:hypothetical protein
MKKLITYQLIAMAIGSIIMYSCSSENTVSKEQNSKDNFSSLQKQSSIFGYVESTQIDNGVNCKNNILIFPTWDKYWETIEKLDLMIENDCDAFDATLPDNISEDEYNTLADAAGFDEDNILRKFEDDLDFCSLRQKIESLETEWLSQQGDGEWDANADPDNHFIDDETERSLLSCNAEVIIGNKRDGYVYYKFIDDEGNWIEVHNSDSNSISQVSQGNIPANNPNVVVVAPTKEEQSSYKCKDKVKEVKFEISDDGSERLKRISKVRPSFGTNCNENQCNSVFPSKVKAKTKGYKKKNGKWKARRLWIAVGINGETQEESGLSFVDCVYENELHKYKEKRRRRVKVKVTTTNYIPIVGTPQRYNNLSS